MQIYGRHYHNADDEDDGIQYVRKTLMKNLASQKMFDMGVSYPVLIKPGPILPAEIPIPSPKRRGDDTGAALPAGGMSGGGDAATATEQKVQVKQFVFRVQFVWQPDLARKKAALPANAAGAVSTATATTAAPTAAAATPRPVGSFPRAAGTNPAPLTGSPLAPGGGLNPGKGLAPPAPPAAGGSPPKP